MILTMLVWDLTPLPFLLTLFSASCFLRQDAGTCYAYMPSWFYNKETQKCEQFIYGGCGGNANRFATEADCQRACSLEGLLVCGIQYSYYFYPSISGSIACVCLLLRLGIK